jgi:hypothetical protein
MTQKMITLNPNGRLNRRYKARNYLIKAIIELVREHDRVFLIESLYG